MISPTTLLEVLFVLSMFTNVWLLCGYILERRAWSKELHCSLHHWANAYEVLKAKHHNFIGKLKAVLQ